MIPEEEELDEPVTEFSMFFNPKNLNNPKYPKIIASLKEIISLFGTTKLVCCLLYSYIFSIR